MYGRSCSQAGAPSTSLMWRPRIFSGEMPNQRR